MTIEERLARIAHDAKRLLASAGEAFDSQEANAIRHWQTGAESMLEAMRKSRSKAAAATPRERMKGDPEF